jgi:hypothetical protein
MSPPSTQVGPSTPSIPGGFVGVRIAAPAVLSTRGRVVVSGIFQILADEAQAIGPHLHRALVAVMTSGGIYGAYNPFREVVLFADDEERHPWGSRGYFHFDLFEDEEELDPADYHVFVSLGEHLSNVVAVAVR